MANHKSALKRHRQSLVRRARNRMVKTRIKNVVKAVNVAIDEKRIDDAKEALTVATSVLDKAATKKVIHKSTAARRISRLAQAINKAANTQ